MVSACQKLSYMPLMSYSLFQYLEISDVARPGTGARRSLHFLKTFACYRWPWVVFLQQTPAENHNLPLGFDARRFQAITRQRAITRQGLLRSWRVCLHSMSGDFVGAATLDGFVPKETKYCIPKFDDNRNFPDKIVILVVYRISDTPGWIKQDTGLLADVSVWKGQAK